MTVFADGLNQDGLYWPPGAPDGYGNVAVGDPAEVKLRWQDSVQQFRDRSGEIALSEAVAYIDQRVEVGGKLKLGTDVIPSEGKTVRAVMISPSVDAETELVKAMLGDPE